jgi:hypothetical protein
VPGWIARAASQLATASLFVYLTHFMVYPHLVGVSPLLAIAASIGVGIAYCRVWTWAQARTRVALRSLGTTLAARRGSRAGRATSGRPAPGEA